MEKIVGVFGNSQWRRLEAVLEDPSEIDRYKEAIGLNLVFLGGEKAPPPEVQALNPFPEEVRSERGPGADFAKDDITLRRAIDLFHSKGVKCWLISVGWHTGGASMVPDLLAVDLWGRRGEAIPSSRYGWEPHAGMLCPTNEAVNAWIAAYLGYLASAYEADGTFFTHSRYVSPASLGMLWACGCPSCQAKAEELGFNFQAMRKSMLEFWNRLGSLDPKKVKLAAESSLGLSDWFQILGGDGGVLEWFEFRARALSQNFSRFAQAVHAARSDAIFAPQAIYPSLGLFCGHDYQEFVAKVDYTISILSWLESHALNFAAAVAEMIVTRSKGVNERDALRLAYRLAGWDSIPGMPDSIAELGMPRDSRGAPKFNAAYEELLGREIEKARLLTWGHKDLPTLRGSGWPKEAVDRLAKLALEVGCEGIMYHSYRLPWE